MARPALWLALAITLALPAAAGAQPLRGSVVGGRDAEVSDWPFVAALVVRGEPAQRGQFCGGTVADATHVITAAHCVEGESAGGIDVMVGTARLAAGGERLKVASLAIAPGYGGDGSAHDLAVLRLAEPVTAGAPLAAATQEDASLGNAGTPVRVAGWGLVSQSPPTTPDVLQQAALTVVGPSRCRKAYGGDFDASLMICAGTPDVGVPDSCSGDSGGPLVADGPQGPRLVGVVSYGSEVCGDPEAPAAYTRVSAESAFVANQLGGAPPPAPEPTPPADQLDPRVEIGRIWCKSRCYVEVGATGAGAEAVPGLVVRVRRSRKGNRKAVDRTYSAKRLSNTRWRAKVGLPYGTLRISARAVNAGSRTIGSTDRVSVDVVP